MEMPVIILSLAVLLLLVALFFRKPQNAGNVQALLDLKDSEHQKTLARLYEERDRQEDLLADLRAELMKAHEKVVHADASLNAQREKLAEQERSIQAIQEKFKLEFENVANKVLEEKSAKFSFQNRESLDAILNPLKENIKAFEEKVEKVYRDEASERSKLEGVLKEMMDQSRQIQTDANNLTKALKGDSKKQGNWGEVVLERVLERSGLVKGQEYRIQASLNSAEGGRFSPDVIIDLPDQKNLIVDAKVSLIAYEQMVNAELDEERNGALKLHIQSVKAHIDGLASKQYQHLYDINSPDFVLLFMPIESSFSITIQADHDIFSYAWARKVVIVSPSTLLATLRTIASIWKVDRQNRNVFAIAEEAGSLYDKFVGFLEDMDKVGKNIGQAQKAHEDAVKKLHSGSGNLIGKVEKIKKMGAKVKSSKQIDAKYLDPEDDLS